MNIYILVLCSLLSIMIGESYANTLDEVRSSDILLTQVTNDGYLNISNLPYIKSINYFDLRVINGFSENEEEFGKWVEGDTISLRFVLPLSHVQDHLNIQFNFVSILLAENNPEIKITPYIKDYELDTQIFKYGNIYENFSIVIPKSLLSEEGNNLTIKIQGMKSPLELGMNDDERLLSFCNEIYRI